MKFLDTIMQKVKNEDYEYENYDDDYCDFRIKFEDNTNQKYCVDINLSRDEMGDTLFIQVSVGSSDDFVKTGRINYFSILFPDLDKPLRDTTFVYEDKAQAVYEERWLFDLSTNNVDRSELDVANYDFIKCFLDECENNEKELSYVFGLILNDFDKYLEYIDLDDTGRELLKQML